MNNKAVRIVFFSSSNTSVWAAHVLHAKKNHLIYSMLQYCPYVLYVLCCKVPDSRRLVTSVSPPFGPMNELIELIWRRSVWPTTVASFLVLFFLGSHRPGGSPRPVFVCSTRWQFFFLYFIVGVRFICLFFWPIMVTTFSPLTLHRCDVVNSWIRGSLFVLIDTRRSIKHQKSDYKIKYYIYIQKDKL